MKRNPAIQFYSAGAALILEYRDGSWNPSAGANPRYSAVWSGAAGYGDELDAHPEIQLLELAPIASLRFPDIKSIEEAGAAAVALRLKSEGEQIDENSALKSVFVSLWAWLKAHDRDLVGWACGFADRLQSDRLAMLRLFYELEFDAVARLSVARYVPLPPAQPEPADSPGVKNLDPESLVLSAFQEEGRLARAMENFEFRPEQSEMASKAWSAMESGRHLMIEAGTGIGKSLAYLIPAALKSAKDRTPVIVSTNTINLQQQLMGQDIPAVIDAIDGIKLAVSLLKGRSHYFCRLRAKDSLFGGGEYAQRVAAICAEGGDEAVEFAVRAAFWQAASLDGDMDSIPQPPGLGAERRGAIQRAIDCGSATCIRNKCQFREHCWFYRARDRAMKAHIIVMNHALLFRLFGAQNDDVETLLDKVKLFVLDEAHNLEDVISGQFTSELTGQWMLDLANDILRLFDDPALRDACAAIASAKDGGAEKPMRLRDEVLDSVKLWISAKRELDGWASKFLGGKRAADLSLTNPEYNNKDAAELDKLLTEAAGALEKLKNAAEAVLPKTVKADSDFYIEGDEYQTQSSFVQQSLIDAEHTLSALTEDAGETVRWVKVSLSREGVVFRCYACPIEIGEIFGAFLEKQQTVIMTSATLSAGGDFSYLKSRLGLTSYNGDALECVRLSTPFNIETQARVVIPTGIPEPDFSNMTPYIEYTARIIGEIAEGFGGGTLALFNSYSDLEKVAAIASKRLAPGLTLLCQRSDGQPHVLAGRMKGGSGIVLFGTKSFWEGFDMPGDDLRAVVLTRLPFANFKEPVLKARAEAIKERGGNDFMEFSVPQAAMRFAQGFGRLIRSKTDRGCIFVLDSRIVTKKYGGIFLKSLPAHAAMSGPADEVIPGAIEWYRTGGRVTAGGG